MAIKLWHGFRVCDLESIVLLKRFVCDRLMVARSRPASPRAVGVMCDDGDPNERFDQATEYLPTPSLPRSNASNLDASTLAFLREKYGGTRLGRQEMDAELLADLEGALWNRALIDECRIRRGDQPERLLRVVVAVDPPGGASKANAECGIIVAGLGMDRHGYVLADLSGRMSPEQWARRVVEAYHGYKADKIVAEQNFGGAMVESTIRSIDSRVPIKMVVASRGKQIRAEPVASWYEQHRVHHVGEFPLLEDQMVGWDPAESGPSPDRVDACVTA
jgi:predicted phage terminase large subunit-like protein